MQFDSQNPSLTRGQFKDHQVQPWEVEHLKHMLSDWPQENPTKFPSLCQYKHRKECNQGSRGVE